MFKKVTKYLFSAAAVFAAVFTLGGAEVSAADYTIGLNEEKEFTSVGYDENVVNFTTPKTGSFHVEVVLTDTFNKEGKSVNFNNVSLKQSLVCDYKKLWSGSGNRNDGIVSTPEYCLPSGKTVSIKLAGNFADTTFKYKVKVVNVADKYFEKESNDNAKKATSIKKKKIYTGVLNENADSDWFVFKAPKNGSYKFYVVDTEESWKPFAATGYKSKYKEDTNKNGRKNITPGEGWIKVASVKLKKGQKYYIKVHSAYTNNTIYKIKVK